MRSSLYTTFFLFLSLLSVANALPNLDRISFYCSSFFSVEFAPSNFDFWRSAKELGEKAVDFANKELKDATALYTDVSEKVDEFKKTIENLSKSAEVFRIESQDSFQIVSLKQEEFTQALFNEIEIVIKGLKAEFREPLPEDQTERYAHRARAVSIALDRTEGAVVKVHRMFGIHDADAREKFALLRPHIQHLVLVVGNIADKHPQLVETLLFTAVIMFVPQGWILRPLLRAFGFGPQGTVKGSAAAWAQRFFYRAAIEEGSWFSKLQSAGMKWDVPSLGRTIIDWIKKWWGGA